MTKRTISGLRAVSDLLDQWAIEYDNQIDVYKVEISRDEEQGRPVITLPENAFRRVFAGHECQVEPPYSVLARFVVLYSVIPCVSGMDRVASQLAGNHHMPILCKTRIPFADVVPATPVTVPDVFTMPASPADGGTS